MIGIIQNPELKSIMLSKDIKNAITSRIKSNLRPPDIKILFNILANCNEIPRYKFLLPKEACIHIFH